MIFCIEAKIMFMQQFKTWYRYMQGLEIDFLNCLFTCQSGKIYPPLHWLMAGTLDPG